MRRVAPRAILSAARGARSDATGRLRGCRKTTRLGGLQRGGCCPAITAALREPDPPDDHRSVYALRRPTGRDAGPEAERRGKAAEGSGWSASSAPLLKE